MKNTKAFKIFESEFKNRNVTWFSDEALNFLKETLPFLTVKEQEDILYVILTVNFKKGTNNIKKLCRLISESYFTVPIVNIFWNSINHIFSFEVSSNSENSITTFPHFLKGTVYKNLYPLFLDKLLKGNKVELNILAALERFYKENCNMPLELLVMMSQIEQKNNYIKSVTQYTPTSISENDEEDWEDVFKSSIEVTKQFDEIRTWMINQSRKTKGD